MIRWSLRAARDLEDTFAFLAKDDVAAARDVARRILAAIEGLTTLPGRGRPGRVHGTRELLVPTLPHCIVYRVVEQEIELVRILHVRQSWPEAPR